MARTTADEVRAIMDDSTIPDALVNACIIGANALVSNVFATDTTLGDTLLEEIERWLAAHMVASSPNYRLAKKEGAGGASIEYTGKYDSNLSSTPYGQMALTLDSTGRLATLGGKGASFTAATSFS